MGSKYDPQAELHLPIWPRLFLRLSRMLDSCMGKKLIEAVMSDMLLDVGAVRLSLWPLLFPGSAIARRMPVSS